MTPRLTDIQKISKENCEIEDCPNKAAAIFKRKYLCKQCYSKENPTSTDRRLYINPSITYQERKPLRREIWNK